MVTKLRTTFSIGTLKMSPSAQVTTVTWVETINYENLSPQGSVTAHVRIRSANNLQKYNLSSDLIDAIRIHIISLSSIAPRQLKRDGVDAYFELRPWFIPIRILDTDTECLSGSSSTRWLSERSYGEKTAGDRGRRANRLGAVGRWRRPRRTKRRRQLRRSKRGRKGYEAASLPKPTILGWNNIDIFWPTISDTFSPQD
jgi:hypothetical protein